MVTAMAAFQQANVRGCIAAILAAFACLICASPILARDIHEDFRTLPLDANWFVCKRAENSFIREPRGPGAGSALRLDVRPRSPVTAAVAFMAHPECTLDADREEKYERAEIWEKDCDFEPFGTEVWQSFMLRMDATARPVADRLVAGQWKEGMRVSEPDCVSAMLPGGQENAMADNTRIRLGSSPFVAQRFEQRQFSITLEQDDHTAAQSAPENQCRVQIAVDANRPLDRMEILAHGADRTKDKTVFVPIQRVASGGLTPLAEALAASCLRDLSIERFAALPNPFGAWVSMKLHIIANASDTGLVEVWADGALIARAKGRIGSLPPGGRDAATLPRAVQYFKFGPYRNLESFPLSAWIADYGKARREADLTAPPP